MTPLCAPRPTADVRLRPDPGSRDGLGRMIPVLATALVLSACTVPVASADPEPRASSAGIDGGGLPSTVRLHRKHPRLMLKFPREKRLDCRKNSDCAFWTPPCSCPPCGDVWREVVNRKELARLRAAWAVRRCKQPACKPCEGRYLGRKPICFAGQCAAE